MYMVGRDIAHGIYAGVADEGLSESCYWARLSNALGDIDGVDSPTAMQKVNSTLKFKTLTRTSRRGVKSLHSPNGLLPINRTQPFYKECT